jgi:hypothetical protein
MELDEALSQIADIRRQMARGEVYRGYRSSVVGGSGVLALAGAAVQPWWVPDPGADLGGYLALWLGVAAAGLVGAGAEMTWRAWRAGPGLSRQHTRLAAEQFLPCVAVGALLTLALARGAPEVAWTLPGLWALVYSLGIFASGRLLPRPVVGVGAYYVACGCFCLLWGRGPGAAVLAPWQMGVTFGGGQLLAAAILYGTLERGDGIEGPR